MFLHVASQRCRPSLFVLGSFLEEKTKVKDFNESQKERYYLLNPTSVEERNETLLIRVKISP